MSNKTPYEIRLDILVLATSIVMEQHKAKAAVVGEKMPTTSPTIEEIMAEAEKLNTFVCYNNPSPTTKKTR